MSSEEAWGKEENPHKGWYGHTGREFLDEAAGPACWNLEACISPVWVANVCIK